MSEVSAEELNGVAERAAEFRQRLDDACHAAGRAPGEVSLIAVTKNHPPEYAAKAIACGLLDLGENKPQELAAKRAGVAANDPAADLRATWHFIGRLQRNKAKQVVANADMVHSVDRLALADTLAKSADSSARWSAHAPLPVLLQVNLDPQAPRGEHDSSAARGGVHPADVLSLANEVMGHEILRVRGLMAIAPLDVDPNVAFERLYRLSLELRVELPAAEVISAGMTNDYRAAITHGATHVRVGTAIFGERRLA